MARLLNIFFAAAAFAACTPDGNKLPSATAVYNLSLGRENRMPSVDHFFPSYYNIELLDADSLHPVMEITYMSRRQSGDDYRWVDAVLRMDITAEQRTLLRELMNEGAWAP